MTIGPYTACIGLPRSGTTWLYQYLKQNTNAHHGWIKEINWFNTHFPGCKPELQNKAQEIWDRMRAKAEARGGPLRPWELIRQDRAHLRSSAEFRAFLERWSQPGQPVMDISPGYSSMPPAAFADMKETFPDARIILLMRNPPDRLWSGAAHRKKLHRPEATELQLFNELLDETPPDGPGAEGVNPLPFAYANARSVFDASEILTIYTEELFSPQRAERVAQICDFMRLEHRANNAFEYVDNKGEYGPMPSEARARAVARCVSSYALAQSLTGYLPPKWQADLDRITPGMI
ncbi:sulfotransferase [Tropicibacter naphthalenivorans]|uniref:Sulfotransferase domain protein n=1 Tax=Tropicibacter naphthalenivorans TaxID=441103 RepID=A0A0P1GQF2_9RHOB|nr:sulfotransferase [Tropicibacter naphthalenivorans]CUH77438.1 Sulfotransferase domain protein [Tropicibacter naphthalenivorans]SMC57526.1 Sulfotransferase family protein [Tropicibacter naphthalenivorans]